MSYRPGFYSLRRRVICHASAIFIAVCVVGPISFIAFDRAPPFELAGGHTIPPELMAGKPYQFGWNIIPKRARDCDGTVYWRIIDSQGTIWATPPAPSLFATFIGSEPRRVVGRERIMPSGIPPGPVTLKSSMEFICNWTQKHWPIRVDFPDVKSIIVK